MESQVQMVSKVKFSLPYFLIAKFIGMFFLGSDGQQCLVNLDFAVLVVCPTYFLLFVLFVIK